MGFSISRMQNPKSRVKYAGNLFGNQKILICQARGQSLCVYHAIQTSMTLPERNICLTSQIMSDDLHPLNKYCHILFMFWNQLTSNLCFHQDSYYIEAALVVCPTKSI